MSVLRAARIPVIGFAAFSGVGKTTLLKQLLPLLVQRGLRIAMIKHAHHAFDIDHPGKDSYELRRAGASQMLVASSQREALIVEKTEAREPGLAELIGRIDQDSADLILVEGFKHSSFPKVELYRASMSRPALYPDDADIIAVATDGELPFPTDLPVLDINTPRAMADFIMQGLDFADDPAG